MIPDDRTLGEWLRDARMDKDLTLREIASPLGIAPSYISEIENDRRIPAEDVLKKIAAVLELSFDEAMARAGRFGEAAERYIRRHPDAVTLMRRVSTANLTREQLHALSEEIERIKGEEKS